MLGQDATCRARTCVGVRRSQSGKCALNTMLNSWAGLRGGLCGSHARRFHQQSAVRCLCTTPRNAGLLASTQSGSVGPPYGTQGGDAADRLRLLVLPIHVKFEVDVPETQVDWALSHIGPVLPLLCSDHRICVEPVICRRADLCALRPQEVDRRMGLSICAYHQFGHLLPIGIEAALLPAYIRSSYLRYMAFQWLDTVGEDTSKVERLREVLRPAVAFALLAWMGVDPSVRVEEAQNCVAMPKD